MKIDLFEGKGFSFFVNIPENSTEEDIKKLKEEFEGDEEFNKIMEKINKESKKQKK